MLAQGALAGAEEAAQAGHALGVAMRDPWAIGRASLQLGVIALARPKSALMRSLVPIE